MPYASRKSTRKTYRRKAAPRRKTRRTARRTRRAPLLTGKPIGARYAPPQPQNQRGYLPFATAYNVRLPYAHTTGFAAPGSSLSGTFDFSLSSAYDPDQTGIGHQPMMWDQLSGLYRRYMTHAAVFTLEFTNPTADGLFVGYAIRYTGDAGGHGAKTLDQLSEYRNVVMKPIQNTGSQKVVFRQYVPLHKVFGLPKMIYNADRATFSGLTGNFGTGTNPLRHVLLCPLIVDSTGGTTSCNVRIGVTFYSTLYDPLWQAQS